MNKVKCKICNREFKNYIALSKHLKFKHNLSSTTYYEEFLLKENEGKCKVCGNKTIFKNLRLGYNKTCSKKCMGILKRGENNFFYGKTHSEESMIQMVKKRRENNSYVHSQETKNRISKALKGRPHYWGVSGTTGKNHSEETKEKISKKALESFQNGRIPFYKGKKMPEEIRKKISAGRLNFFKNGGKSWNNGLNKYNNKILKTTGKKISKKAKERIKKNLEIYGKKEPPDLTKKRISRSLAVVCKRPNTFEYRVGEHLNKLFPNKFEYTGNGSILVNGKSPDFIDRKNKIVVLCHGLYWHLLRYGLKDTSENKRKIELRDSKPFIEKGYDVWFIWELQETNLKKYKSKKEITLS